MKQESEFMTALSRRAMVAFGGGLATFGLGNLLALDADAKKRKRRRRKNKKRKKPQGSVVLVAPEMTGAKEAPPPDAGDDNGQGSGEVTIKGTQICWDFEFSTTTPPNSDVSDFHIHEGPPGEDGDIVVDFEGELEGCKDIEGSLAAQIKTNPEDFYANIHTDAFPNGAVRDQLQVKA